MDVPPRCFHPDLDAASIVLSDEESGHLTRVLRLRAGARVLVFDGRGHQRAGLITSSTRSRATLELEEAVPAAPEPAVTLTLAQAALKGDKMDEVIRDATMMGVAIVRPLVTARSVVPRAAVAQARTRDRWQRVALASAKQCGRAVVPIIAPVWSLQEMLTDGATLAASTTAARGLVPDAASIRENDADAPGKPGESGESEEPGLASSDAVRARAMENASDLEAARLSRLPACRLLLTEPATGVSGRTLPAVPPASALIAVGPEGGWAPEEVEQALAAGFQALTLGERTLRAESAPLAALSVLSWVWRL